VGTVLVMTRAPLIVDGRLRIFADRHGVTADGPLDAVPDERPYWSLRRNWVDLLTVVAMGTSVVSLWDDGELVALDARTGAISWRVDTVPTKEARYPGNRTGSSTVYPLDSLFTAAGDNGRGVVLHVNDNQLSAYDAAAGTPLWHKTLDGPVSNCYVPGFTTATGEYITQDYCQGRESVEFYSMSTGVLKRTWAPPSVESDLGLFPAGCLVGRSQCSAMMALPGGPPSFWAFTEDEPAPALGATNPTMKVAGDVAIEPVDPLVPRPTSMVGRDLLTGTQRWRWDSPGGEVEIVATEPDAVHVLTSNRDLITIDARSGRTRSTVSLLRPGDSPQWWVGTTYASDGFVVVERLVAAPTSMDDDDDYYFAKQPVVFART
jgi:outer membrane protein assembly factor BamB